MNIFEEATRLKLRFPSTKGALSLEDLWDLPLTSKNGPSLDNVARAVNSQLKESAEESFVTERSSANTELQLKMDVALHVIGVRKAENQAKIDAKAREQKKAQLEDLINRKKNEALEGKSLEDLQKELESL